MSIRNFFQNPAVFLRLGLGVMFIYSGASLLWRPLEWEWAVSELPQFIETFIRTVGVELFLRFQGVFELIFALGLLGWFLPWRTVAIIAGLASAEMLSILLFVGVNASTFRDFGLLGALLALFGIAINRLPARPLV